MRIAVIGAGNVGSALARAFRTAGHTVVISSRHPSHAEKIAGELDVSAASSNRVAAENTEMLVLAVPAKAVATVLDETAEFLDGVIVVDPTNPAEEDAETVLRASASLAEAVALLAPGARVVKAFNTVFVHRLNNPVIDGIALDGFYAGDDAPAKQVVANLLADMGFRPVDTGELLTARALELMAHLNITLNARGGGSWQSGWKLLGPVG